MIGNYGVEEGVGESDGVQAAALVCRAARNAAPLGRDGPAGLARRKPAFRPSRSIDTRALVRHLRERGAMRGAVVTDGTPAGGGRRAHRGGPADGRPGPHRRRLAAAARARRGGRRALPRRRSSTTAPRTRSRGSWPRRARTSRCCRTTRPPTTCRASEPDGILLANGPGDPGGDGRARRPHRARCSTWSGRCSASASATSCSPGRSGWRPSSCASATAAPTTRCWSARPAACW